jgi:hypothetical protein
LKKLTSEPFKPGSRSLFEAIDGLMLLAHIVRMLRINIALWLRHINFLLEDSMEECIANIKLSQRPVERDY